jgi:hypothetical protein
MTGKRIVLAAAARAAILAKSLGVTSHLILTPLLRTEPARVT